MTIADPPVRPVFQERPLIGRRREVDAVTAALDRLEAGAGRCIQVLGDPGTGKSRLLAELRRRAAKRGMDVCTARAGESGSTVPFQVFVEALDDRVRRLPPDGLPGPALEVVRQVFALAGDGHTEDVPRFRVFQALRDLLCAVGAERRLVLVLDDVHWGDPESIDFFDYLCRHPVPVPLLFALAARPRQAPARLRSALIRSAEQFAVTRLELGPLSRADAAELVGMDPDDPALGRLYQESQGIPLYLLGGARPGAATTTQLEALILGEIDALQPHELDTASTAAVLGDPFAVDVLTAVSGLSPSALGEALSTLTRRDLLRSVPGRPELTFRHPTVRRIVYDHAEPTWRMRTHRKALEELTRAGAPALERARHIERYATSWQQSHFEVLCAAGRELMGTAPLAAAHWFALAGRRLPDVPENRAARFEARYQLARALGLGGRLAQSRNLLHEILAGTPECSDAARAAAVTFCAHVEQRLGRYREAMSLLRREIAARGADRFPQSVALRIELGLTALLANRYDSAREDVAWAVAAARAEGDTLAEATALALSAFGNTHTGRMPAAKAATEAAAALVDGLPDGLLASDGDALMMLGWAELLQEQFADAERHLLRDLGIMRRRAWRHGLPNLLLGLGLTAMFTGRMDEALSWTEQAENEADAMGSDRLLGIVLAVQSPILCWSRPDGGKERALRLAERAVALCGDGSGWWDAAASAILGYAALTGGDANRCVALVQAAGGGPGLPRLGNCLAPMFTETLVQARAQAGDVAGAQADARTAVEAARVLGLAGQLGHATRATGVALETAGELGAAVAEFAAAAEAFARAGQPVEEARARVFGASALLADDRPAEAAAWLTLADRLTADTGADAIRQEIARIRGTITDPGAASAANPDGAAPAGAAPAGGVPDGGAPDGLAALTDRERDVARLVADGASNRDIAERLHLSVRTVEAHLAHIYRKLGVASRAVLAVEAARSAG